MLGKDRLFQLCHQQAEEHRGGSPKTAGVRRVQEVPTGEEQS